MIKIEFKETQPIVGSCGDAIANFMIYELKYLPKSISIKSLTFGCVSELVTDRSEILKQLGISQQEDEIFQEQYKNV